MLAAFKLLYVKIIVVEFVKRDFTTIKYFILIDTHWWELDYFQNKHSNLERLQELNKIKHVLHISI